MLRIAADLGNTRLKWGRIDAAGEVGPTVYLPTDDPAAWDDAWRRWSPGTDAPSAWVVASVNPPAGERLLRFLVEKRVSSVVWLRSAAEVPVRHVLPHPEATGSDRALAVFAAVAAKGGCGPGLVVLCGTAMTVERVGVDGVWQGGAIAAGLRLTANALHASTAQLPFVPPRSAPPPWGDSTVPAIEAGVFWGAVGAARELIARQSEGLGPDPWVAWAGGDAELLAPVVGGPDAWVVPDLVLRGLARVTARRDP